MTEIEGPGPDWRAGNWGGIQRQGLGRSYASSSISQLRARAEALGAGRCEVHPETPTAHTPSGGCHILFQWPGHYVRSTASKLGQHLDIRSDGGALILPPGPGRYWDSVLGLEGPVAPMPAWLEIEEQKPLHHYPAALECG